MSTDTDVLIVGAGPAGRWLGALLARRGVGVTILDPSPGREWPNNYGVWLDEVDGLMPPWCLDSTWSQVVVYAKRRIPLERAYGRVDNAAFRRHLDAMRDDGGGRLVEGTVVSVECRDRCVVAHTAKSGSVEARLVVDATGGGAVLAGRGEGGDPGYQRAFGLVVDLDADPLRGDEMVLMDFRPIPGTRGDEPPPSFLYGMHLGEGRYFLEETVLVERCPTSFEALHDRLMRRLRGRGVDAVGEPIERERCHIAMGTPLPVTGEGVAAFGAAAGLVHPATGYQLSRMLHAGVSMADVVAEGLAAGSGPDELSRRCFRALWPPPARRARRLLMFGRDVLLDRSREELARFFDDFFSLQHDDWCAYLRGSAPLVEVLRVMWRLFVAGTPETKRIVLHGGLGDIRRRIQGSSNR